MRFTEEGKEEEWAIGQCDPSTKPAGQRPCNMQQCYAEWSEGPWSEVRFLVNVNLPMYSSLGDNNYRQ